MAIRKIKASELGRPPKVVDRALTKLEMEAYLIDTVLFYARDTTRRAHITSSPSAGLPVTHPVYRTKAGKCCAIGRVVRPECAKLLGTRSMSVVGVVNYWNRAFKEDRGPLVTAKENKPLSRSMKFWEAIQNLHDEWRHWSDDGITHKGLEAVAAIADSFKLNKQRVGTALKEA